MTLTIRPAYLAHLLSVAALVIEDGGEEDEAIAALLHDAPEDQGGVARLGDIRNRFGSRVADIVAACSDTFETPKPPWRARKEQYLDKLRSKDDQGMLRVSLADKLHYARAIISDVRESGLGIFERFNASAADQCSYYGARRRLPGQGLRTNGARAAPARRRDEFARRAMTADGGLTVASRPPTSRRGCRDPLGSHR
jgi:hypothetical protein